MRGQRGLHVVRVVLDVVVLQYRLQTSVLFLLTLLGSRSLGCQVLFFGSSACSARGRLLVVMLYSVVCVVVASGFSSFALALGLVFAFGVATPNAPPCGPPDGGDI